MPIQDAHLTWHQGKVNYPDRCALLGQHGLVVWFTGLSGSGKSTLAVEVEKELIGQGRLAYRLDGDNIRHGLNSDLGFTESNRNENIRRIAEVAALFKDAGIITLVAFISPFRQMREFARQRCGGSSFLEVFLNADLETLKTRDVKGLYARALIGELPDFTGVSAPYEPPEAPDLKIDTGKVPVQKAVAMILDKINHHLEKRQ
jgi:adenylylsulfate kinase